MKRLTKRVFYGCYGLYDGLLDVCNARACGYQLFQ